MESEPAARDVASQESDQRLKATIASLRAAYGRSLFPLRLSPLEKFLWWDDSTAHPLCNFIELRFDGRIEHGTMQQSLQLALQLHPLLISRIVSQNGDWYWQPQFDTEVRLYTAEEKSVTLAGRIRCLDLTREVGLVAWYQSHLEGDRLLFGFHHACCDGNGFRRFLLDLLSIYGHQQSRRNGMNLAENEFVPQEVLSRWQPQRLSERFDFTACWPKQARKVLSVWQRIKNAHYFHFQSPEPLMRWSDGGLKLKETIGRESALDRVSEPVSGLHDAFLRRVLAPAETERLLARCQETKASVNEVCLAALFRTCARWHQLTRGSRPGRRLRLLMPFAMMSRDDLYMPAANRLSFAFLGRTEKQCLEWEPLLQSIRQEIESTRATQLPMDFLRGLQAAAEWPRGMRWGIRNSRKMCTAVLSFGGDIARGRGHQLRRGSGALEVAGCRLIQVFGAPPVRINTNVALGVCLSGGSLCIAESWSREAMDELQADRFLQLFLAELLTWSASHHREQMLWDRNGLPEDIH